MMLEIEWKFWLVVFLGVVVRVRSKGIVGGKVHLHHILPYSALPMLCWLLIVSPAFLHYEYKLLYTLYSSIPKEKT